MASFVFNQDHQQLRVTIPPAKKLPPNPHIGCAQDALARALAPPSETADTNSERPPESKDDKGLRHLLLAYDQRSFFTGSAAADLRAAYAVNTIRRDTERKRQVEDYLTHLRLHPRPLARFLLDSTTNAILLEASLHTQWDLYGTFCFVPTEDDARAMLDALKTCNEEWAQGDSSFELIERPLDVSQAPFARPRWEILVLHPHALLPESQPLAISHNRFLYTSGQPVSPVSQLTWTFWTASGDNLLSLSPPNQPLPPFHVPRAGGLHNAALLSSLAMVINAHCKLEQFMQDTSAASGRVQNFAALMSDLVTEIFFMPPRYADVTGFAKVAYDAQYAHSAAGAVASQPAPAVRQSSAATYPVVGAMEDASEPPGEDAVEPPETPDPDDGLTDSEFLTVAAKATDGHLDPRERAAAAMMMLFGTHRYADPYVQGSPVIDG